MIEITNLHISASSVTSCIGLHVFAENINSSIIPKVEETRPAYLSVTEFAKACSITPQAVRKMIAEGRLEAERLGEQHIVPVSELTRYLSIR